jgi:uncharacterized protein YndB with AHSA1/START domain
MTAVITPNATAPIKELVLTREFDAPRSIVFKAWIDPVQLQKWWAPKHFTNPVCEIDPRPGGSIQIEMQGPDGTRYPCGGTFHEIDEPNRLVFTTTGNFDGEPEPQLEVLNTVTFEESNGKTTVKLHAQVLKATPSMVGALAGMDEGWSGSLDKLGQLVIGDTSDREIATTRLFDAPRDLVFDVFTNPEHLKHWWGPNGFTISTYEYDARPGGIWRLCMHGPDGRDYQNRVVFVDVERPYRLAFKHVPDKDTEPVGHLTTATFEAYPGGKTFLTFHMLFASAEVYENVAKKYGAVEGMHQTLGRLADYLTSVEGR